MAIIRDSISTSVLTVDSGSKSIRTIPYNQQGLAISKIATFRAATATTFNVVSTLLGAFFTMYGSTSKIIKILKIGICMTHATTSDSILFELAKRSSLPTGAGLTSNVPLIGTSMDSNMASSTASLLQIYNGGSLPSVGTLSTRIKRSFIYSSIEGSEDVVEYLFDFKDRSGLYYQPLTLRSSSEGIDLSVLGSSNATTTHTTIYVEWTEENK